MAMIAYLIASLDPGRVDWKTDPGRPPAPNYFRLLYMGRMLTDPEVLSGEYCLILGPY